MIEQTLFDVGYQKHTEKVARAEARYSQQAELPPAPGLRGRVAQGLVALATRLQPGLRIEKRPARPRRATA